MSSCSSILLNVLKQNWNDQNPEPNFYMWNKNHCQGIRYPKSIQEVSTFNQSWNAQNTPLQNIKSFYIPPHATLSIRNKNGSTIEFTGPYICEDTTTLLEYWNNGDIFSSIKFKDNVSSLIVHTHAKWNRYIEQLWTKNIKTIDLLPNVYSPSINFNHFYINQCQDNPNDFLCGCHLAFDPQQPDIDIAQQPNSVCNPDIMHVPSKAKVSFHNKESCKQHILQELQSGRLNYEEVLIGQDVITCGTSNISIPVKSLQNNQDTVITETNQSIQNKYPIIAKHRPDLVTYAKNRFGQGTKVVSANDWLLWVTIFVPLFVFILACVIILYLQKWYPKRITKNNAST